MTGQRMTSRTTWLWSCGGLTLAAAMFVTCGPAPIPGSTSDIGGAAGSGRGGSGGPITLATSTSKSTGTDSSVGTSTQVCKQSNNNLTKQNADVLLVLDKTGSMTSAMDSGSQCSDGDADAGTCQQRWSTMVSGVNAVLGGAATTAGSVNWGLELFNSDGNCGVAATPDVAIAAGSAATVQSTIAGVTPGGATPTRQAIINATAYLQTLTDNNGKYILLATDGEPNCLNTGKGGKGGGGQGTTDLTGTAGVINTAYTSDGIKTYVIGVGPDVANLNQLAFAGGTNTYYPALSPQDLDAALSAIVGAVASCTFSLGGTPPDPTNVLIEFNGDSSLRPPQDTSHTNGWDYTTPADTSIQLYGSWCDNVTNGTYSSYEIRMGCPGIPVQ